MFGSGKVQQQAVIHEAGHVVTAMALDVEFVGVSVLVKGENLTVGIAESYNLMKTLTIIYAGDSAVKQFLRKDTTCYADTQHAIGLVSRNTDFLAGMSYADLADEAKSAAQKILDANIPAMQKIARQLRKKKYLSYRECRKIADDVIVPAYITDKKNPQVEMDLPRFSW